MTNKPTSFRPSALPRTVAAASCAIAVMAKASAPGRTKTRLVPPLSPDEAALLNTAFLKDIIGNIEAAAAQAPIAGYVAYGPPGSHRFFEDILPRHVGYFESWSPDFGVCLRRAVDHLFACGHRAAAVLNSDSPTLPPALLAEMAVILTKPGDRAVLGPSSDGGYYVLGLKMSHARLFEDIDWSTARVAEQTLARAREINLPVHVLPTWYDVDDAASLRILHGELFEETPFGEDGLRCSEALHTRVLLRQLFAESGLARRLEFDPTEHDHHQAPRRLLQPPVPHITR